jgi:dynactin-4
MWEDAQDALKQQQQQQQQHQQGDRHVSGDMDKYEVPYERARNWVSIVIEVKADPIGPLPADMKEDEDVLEIPIYVRLEWDEKQGDGGGGGSGSLDKDKDGKDKDGKETRGLEYWCVVGVGRIVQD